MEKEEFETFISHVPQDSIYYYAFEMLYWCGVREGDYHVIIGLNQLETAKCKGFRKIWSYVFLQRNSQNTAERSKKLNKAYIIGLERGRGSDNPYSLGYYRTAGGHCVQNCEIEDGGIDNG